VDEIEDGPELPEPPEERGETAADRLKSAAAGITSGRGRRKRKRGNSFSTGRSGVGVGLMLFALGLFCGIPMAFFGFDYFVEYSAGVFGFLLGLLGTSIILMVLVLVFRRPIWQRLYSRGEIEVEKLAAPLAEVAKNAAAQKMDDAFDAAKNFVELVLARYAWITTRRWLIGSITGLLAAIAALAGSTLLFQQNKLLAEQSVLLQGQTDRLDEQNKLLETQLALAEAERNALIGPEMLAISEAIGQEAEALEIEFGKGSTLVVSQLSRGLRSRIVALSNVARPYRYLTSGEIDPRNQREVTLKALEQRPELITDWSFFGDDWEEKKGIHLIDRPLSPERGQILTFLRTAGVIDTEQLSVEGADFSFAEFRIAQMFSTSYTHAFMSFSDFTGIQLNDLHFNSAILDHSNFTESEIKLCDFSGLQRDQLRPPFASAQAPDIWFTAMNGASFQNAVLANTLMMRIQGLVMNFENAGFFQINFNDSSIGGSIFRNSILVDVVFSGASLQSIDLEGAWVIEPDFLDRLQRQAVSGSFIRERWIQVPGTMQELGNHPSLITLSTFTGDGFFEGKELWKITRNPDFVEPVQPAIRPRGK
jgi:uncharacterized protein YjbI with pentapeptide repeats